MGRLEQAFKKYSRADFVTDNIRRHINFDMALPIGYGQTISQPYTVQLMLEWLEVIEGDKILDIGSGSGWTTALLSYLTGPKGQVYAVERIPELLNFGKNNCINAGVTNAKFYLAGKKYSLPKYAPYDRILVSASAQELPLNLIKQLKLNGKIVIPVNYDILEITKTSATKHQTITHPGFAFVPLI